MADASMPSNDELAERLMDLEVKLAYQDHLIAQLNDLVRATVDRLLAVERDLQQARDSVGDVGITAATPVERPPHY